MRDPRHKLLVKAAKEQGWTVLLTKNSHYCFVSPTGEKVFAASTPGDRRSFNNHRSRLRRKGLDL